MPVAIVTAGLCAGCLKLSPDVYLETIALTMNDRANENNPVAVDLLVINEEPLLEELLKLSARDWFQKRAQYIRDFPTGIDLPSWELVPGSAVPPTPIEVRRRARGAVVFANYYAPGAHRLRLPDQSKVRVLLGEKGFTVAQ